MAKFTLTTNLKGNTIKLKSFTTNTGAGDDNTITIAEYLPDGEEVANTEQTVDVNGGVRGVKFHSGTFVPNEALDANNTKGTTPVIGSLIGDIYLEVDEDRLYERIADVVDTETWIFLSDFTGTTGAGYSNVELNSDNTLTFTGSSGNSNITTGSVKGNQGIKGDPGAGFATYAGSTAYAIGDTVISNNTQWRALDVVEDTNTTDPVEGDVWSEIITASQGSKGPELFSFTGETAVLSTLDIVFSGSWTATAAHGITILGLPTSITTDGRGNLDLRLDAVVGIWGNIAGSWRVFTTVGRGGNASDFIDDMVSIIGNPLINSETGGNPIVTFNEGTITTDLFNITAEKVGSNTLRLTGTAGQFDGVTVVIDGSALGMTLQTGYGSNTLIEGRESTRVPEVDITYTQGAIVFYPDTNPVGYMQLANGSITTSNPAVAAELPGTLNTWKPMTS